jgi:4-amino-4-deoxy-L-arabinose transferase-like glycosyltransferase
MNDRRPSAPVSAVPRETRALAAVVLLGAALRVFHLGYQSLWVDELLTLEVATPKPGYPIGQLLVHNIHGPLHAFVVFLFRALGESDAWLRLPSALAGTAAIPLLFLWLRPRLGARAALWGALLLALNPLHVHYSQELRNYAFAVCFVLAGSVQLDRVLAAWSRRRAALLSVLVAASVLSNFSATFAFAAQSLGYFRGAGVSRRSLGRWGAIAALAAVLMSPWIYRVTTYVDFGKLATPVLPGELDTSERLRGETTFRLEAVPYAAYGYSVGLSLGPSLRELHAQASLGEVLRRHAPVIAWVVLVFGLALTAGLRAAWRTPGRAGTLEVAAYVLIPLVATLLLNWQNAKAFNVRYVIVGLPAYLGLLAAGLTPARRWRGVLAAAVVGTCLVSLANHYVNPRYAREDVKRAVAQMERRMQPGDCVFAPTVWQVVRHYRSVDAPLYFVYADPPGIASGQLAAMFASCPTFWYLRARPWVDDPDGSVRAEIERRAEALERYRFPGVELTRYRMRSE